MGAAANDRTAAILIAFCSRGGADAKGIEQRPLDGGSEAGASIKLAQGAIAYVTRDLVGFQKGNTLVVDASDRAIQNGETDAPLLRKLHKKGVQLYDCADLHAKILLLDDIGYHRFGKYVVQFRT